MELNSDTAFERLGAIFGTTIWDWPTIWPYSPKWYEFGWKRRERGINNALATIGKGPLTQKMRDRYWQQVRYGQGIYEDAGGYKWRCWCAMLDLPFQDPGMSYMGVTDFFVGEKDGNEC